MSPGQVPDTLHVKLLFAEMSASGQTAIAVVAGLLTLLLLVRLVRAWRK